LFRRSKNSKMFDTKKLLTHARDNGYAIGAFNVANLETLKAVVNAAVKLDSPVIIEASAGEVGHMGIGQLRTLVDSYAAETGLPIILNLDHAIDEPSIHQAIESRFDLIHVDASKLPIEENIELTRRVAKLAHQQGLLCEGELDHIQGSSDDHRAVDVSTVQKQDLYTNPDRAVEFVQATGIDTFAAFFGNVHGVFKQPPELDFELLKKIADQVPAFLSMHGGSGIRDEDVQRAIEVGRIVKINVNSELRIAFREELELSLDSGDTVKAYEFYAPVIEGVQKIVEQKIKIFGSDGRAES